MAQLSIIGFPHELSVIPSLQALDKALCNVIIHLIDKTNGGASDKIHLQVVGTLSDLVVRHLYRGYYQE